MTDNNDNRPLCVALISGGKDSFLSLTHTIANSYRIVALANLHPPTSNPSSSPSSTSTVKILPDSPANPGPPPAEGNDELDSFMYQTIGHTLLPLYSRCLNLPLYRQPIIGTHANSDLNYRPASSSSEKPDETEDLYKLLSAVKSDFPGLSAVCSGAILSSYQRTRVESVCIRLGLTSLAYLWQFPQPRVLESLTDLNFDARIVKVAAIGMDERWLWSNLADPSIRRRLDALERKWGVNVAGEGGEFESIVISAPGWRGRVEVKSEDRVVLQEEGGGGATWLEFKAATVEEAEGGTDEQRVWAKDVVPPALLEEEFAELVPETQASNPTVELESTSTVAEFAFATKIHSNPESSTITISNLTAETPEDLMNSLFSHLPPNSIITTIHLSLPSISLFAPLNAIYRTYFPHPLPPSRITIASPLSSSQILCHATAFLPSPRSAIPEQKGLHVQSRSYWAPANIGPYSQATLSPCGGFWDVAGMIPLVPASMKLLEGSVEEQVALGLQHVKRVVEAVDVQAEIRGVVVYNTLGEAAVPRILETVGRWKDGEVECIVIGCSGLPMNAAVEVVGVVEAGVGRGLGRGRGEARVGTGEVDGAEEVVAWVDIEGESGQEEGRKLVERGVRVVPSLGVWGAGGKRVSVGWVRKRVGRMYRGGEDESDSE